MSAFALISRTRSRSICSVYTERWAHPFPGSDITIRRVDKDRLARELSKVKPEGMYAFIKAKTDRMKAAREVRVFCLRHSLYSYLFLSFWTWPPNGMTNVLANAKTRRKTR